MISTWLLNVDVLRPQKIKVKMIENGQDSDYSIKCTSISSQHCCKHQDITKLGIFLELFFSLI